MPFIFYRCGSRTDAGKTWSRARRNRAGTVLAAARTTPRRARPLSSPPASSPASWTRWTTTAPTTSNPARTRAGRWPTTDTSPTPPCHRQRITASLKTAIDTTTEGLPSNRVHSRTRTGYRRRIFHSLDIPLTKTTLHFPRHQSIYGEASIQPVLRTLIQSRHKPDTQTKPSPCRCPIRLRRSTRTTWALHTTRTCSCTDIRTLRKVICPNGAWI